MASKDRKVLIVLKALMMGVSVRMNGYDWTMREDKLYIAQGKTSLMIEETLTTFIARASIISNEEAMFIAEQIGKGEKKSFVQRLLAAGKVTFLDP